MSCRLWFVARVSAFAAMAAVLGCARPETVSDRQFAEMRETVARITADHDSMDQRLGALEIANADEKRAVAAPVAAQPVVAQPVRVVQLGGPDGSEAADPNDVNGRPEIKLTGQPGAASSRPRSGKSGGRVRIEDAETSNLRADSPRPSALDPEAKKSYEAALALVHTKHYDRGLEGLNAFLVRWPDHPYAENAMYWRGEAYFAQGEYLRAAEQFEAVMARFGGGNKAPDALLKLGMCHDRLGASSRAREYWGRLKNEYPRSDAAKRIPAAGRDTAPASRGAADSNSGAREDSLPKGPKENR